MSARRGFTLVELLVVIGVIVFLVGITFSMIAAVGDKAARHQTEVTLRLLETAMQEWETTADRQLTWWNGNNEVNPKEHYEVHSDTDEMLIITEMLQVIDRVPSVKGILGQIPDDQLFVYEEGVYPPWIDNPNAQTQLDEMFDDELTVLDGWGWPIYATHPGRTWTPDDQFLKRNEDGTIQTFNELWYGGCRNRQVCFVSAGPDRAFGFLYLGDAKADDNIFSYPVEEPIPPGQ